MNDKELKIDESENNNLINLGLKISKIRKQKKLSQTYLAEKTGIDRTYIILLEKGKANISYLKLLKICDFLGLSINIDEK